MLAQFRSKYPQGSLISELVQIYHGKYIVRSSVQIDGVTRATGLATADTLEEAEDQARKRALDVLGITDSSEASVVSSSEPVKPTSMTKTNEFNESAVYSPALNVPPPEVTPNQATPDYSSPTHKPQIQLDAPWENLGMDFDHQPEEQTISEISPNNVTPFSARSYSMPEDTGNQTTTTKKKKKSEPVYQSDDIAKIGVEMQRLGWTTDQGRDYLINTYSKRSRHLLTDEELHDFLRYLESQPTPLDPLAGF